MRTKRLISFLLSFMIILSAVCVYAEDISEYSLSVEYDYINNSVSVSGAVGAAGNFVTIIILEKGYSAENLKNNETDTDKIFYMMQQDTNNGEYRFDAEYTDDTETGLYNAYLMSDGIEGVIDIGSLKIVSGKTYEKAIEKLNEAAKAENSDAFKERVETDSGNLGFDLTLYKKLSGSETLSAYINYVKSNPLKADTSDENTRTFNTFVLMAGLGESKVDNINDYLADTVVGTTQLYTDYSGYAESDNRQKYITSKMSGKNTETIADFEKLLKQAFVLAEVRYSNGYESVKEVIVKYGDEVGITDTASNSVYKAMCGVDYKDADALLAGYKSLKKNNSDNTTSSERGTSGGSGGSGAAYMNGEYPESETAASQPINARFVDIEGVDWASEAILALADKGIINGRAEGFFEPDEYVTREEFVKILVGAMGYSDEPYDKNIFSDVREDDWFCGYVNIAYNKNLVRGIGDGSFGSGQLISRQDMAVMIYNALPESEKEVPDGSVVFEDGYKISDYAVQAVGALYKMGIINGVSETEFEPLGYTTRAQAAKVIYGILKHL